MWKVSKDRKKWNQLIDWFKQGDGWIRVSYDYTQDAHWHSPETAGWNRFGAVKWEDSDLKEAQTELSEWLENNEPTHYLIEQGVVYK